MQKMQGFQLSRRMKNGHRPIGFAERKATGLTHGGSLSVTLAALLLTACTTTPEPQIVVKEVLVPTPIPCPIDTTEPVYVADKQSLIEAAKRGADAAVALLLGEIGQRKAWAEGVKRQAEGCRG